MSKIDIDKFVDSMIKYESKGYTLYSILRYSLNDQGLEYQDGEMVKKSPFNIERLCEVAKPESEEEKSDREILHNTFIKLGVSEFDRRINSALEDFEHLPKEELIEVLEFYLNVVKNYDRETEESSTAT